MLLIFVWNYLEAYEAKKVGEKKRGESHTLIGELLLNVLGYWGKLTKDDQLLFVSWGDCVGGISACPLFETQSYLKKTIWILLVSKVLYLILGLKIVLKEWLWSHKEWFLVCDCKTIY